MDDEVIEALESALVQQWHHFGTGPGAAWHEDGDLTWLEAPVAQLPYNGVLHTRLPDEPSANDRIAEMTRHFIRRQVPFLWIVHPTASPGDLASRLTAAGVGLVETARGMVLDLEGWSPTRTVPDGVRLVEVHDAGLMDDFETLTVDYWQLLPQSRPFVFAVLRSVGLGPSAAGVRFLAYVDDEPAAKTYLSFLGSEGTAAIFAVSVPKRFRSRGLASALMELATAKAQALGYRRLVLHSTEMAFGMYLRLGFRDVAPFAVHATTGLH